MADQLASANEKNAALEKQLAGQAYAALVGRVIVQANKPETRLLDVHLSSPFPGEVPSYVDGVVNMIKTDEAGVLYFLDEHGVPQYGNAKGDAVVHALKFLKKRDTAKQYFTEVTQKGSRLEDNGPKTKTGGITRQQYDGMSPAEQSKYFAGGGTVVD